MPTKTIKLSKATTTPLVENIFESFFSGEIMRNYTRDYSDAGTGLTTNRVFNSTRSHDDYNLVSVYDFRQNFSFLRLELCGPGAAPWPKY